MNAPASVFAHAKIINKPLLRLTSATVAVTFMFSVCAPIATISAEELISPTNNNPTVTAGEVSQALQDVPGVLAASDQIKTTSDADSAIQAVTAGSSVDIPKDASDGITLSSTDPTNPTPAIDITLPNASTAKDAQTVANGTVAYQGNNGSANAVQATEDGGVRMLTIIDNKNAPTAYDYKVTVPNGGRIELTEDGGAVVFDSTGNPVAAVNKPWAKDANETPVNTYFTTDGLTLTQHIEHNVGGVVYPVTADPWWYVNSIHHVTRDGSILRVYPTTWGRYWARLEMRWAAWGEVVRLYPKANTPSMRDQFYCHWDLVRMRAPNKVSWNLDFNRPDVGYWTTVKKNCNP